MRREPSTVVTMVLGVMIVCAVFYLTMLAISIVIR